MNNELIDRAVNQISTAKPVERTGNDYAASLINDLFKSLKAAKPGWRASIPDDKAEDLLKKTWVKAFIENRINTPEQLSAGMGKVRADDSDFFPSVGKFIKWCKPDPVELGIPSMQECYKLCCNQYRSPSRKPWPHPAVYWMGKTAGWFLLGTETEAKSRKVFSAVYDDIIKRVAAGEAFSIPSTNASMLENHTNGKKVNTEKNKEVANEALNNLKGMLK